MSAPNWYRDQECQITSACFSSLTSPNVVIGGLLTTVEETVKSLSVQENLSVGKETKPGDVLVKGSTQFTQDGTITGDVTAQSLLAKSLVSGPLSTSLWNVRESAVSVLRKASGNLNGFWIPVTIGPSETEITLTVDIPSSAPTTKPFIIAGLSNVVADAATRAYVTATYVLPTPPATLRTIVLNVYGILTPADQLEIHVLLNWTLPT